MYPHQIKRKFCRFSPYNNMGRNFLTLETGCLKTRHISALTEYSDWSEVYMNTRHTSE